MTWQVRLRYCAAIGLCALALSCVTTTQPAGAPSLGALRREGPTATSADLLGRWLLAELVSPGGEASQALRARARLDQVHADGLRAALGRAVDDAAHGRLRSAPVHYLEAVRAARGSDDPAAPLVAWLGAHEAVRLRDKSPGLWKAWQGFVTEAMREPAGIGWRARIELVEWWVDEEYSRATRDVEQLAARELGCVTPLRIAGPFGHGAAPDVTRSFPAEDPGPWP